MPRVKLGRGLRASLCVMITRLELQALSFTIPVTIVCVSPLSPMSSF